MPGKPRDRLPQRRLVYELRIAIDRARTAHTPAAHKSALAEVQRLVRENPNSSRASYVTHNLGRWRSEWLTPVLMQHAPATSLRSTSTR